MNGEKLSELLAGGLTIGGQGHWRVGKNPWRFILIYLWFQNSRGNSFFLPNFGNPIPGGLWSNSEGLKFLELVKDSLGWF